MELNDLTTRSAAGSALVSDVRIRDFAAGSQAPVIKTLAVEKAHLSPDKESFRELQVRPWLLRRVAMELNDLTTRSAAGSALVSDVRIRDFAAGSQAPVIKTLAVEKAHLSPDKESFRELQVRPWLLRRVAMELNDLTTRSAAGSALVSDVRIRDFAAGSQAPVIKTLAVEKAHLSPDKESFRELQVRPWLLRRVAMELNDLTTRSAAGSALVSDVRIRDFAAGSQAPVIKTLAVEKAHLSPDKESFRELQVRPWLLRRVAMELNDLTTRSAAGSALVSDVRIRDFAAGSQAPVIKTLAVEKAHLSPDKESFRELQVRPWLLRRVAMELNDLTTRSAAGSALVSDVRIRDFAAGSQAPVIKTLAVEKAHLSPDKESFRELQVRPWLLRRVAMELNDLTTRSAAGSALVSDVRIRDFAAGSQAPVIKTLAVEKAHLSPDKESFRELQLLLDVDYRGGMHLAVDAVGVLGRKAFLSVTVARIAGQARLTLSREPYTHWSLAFTGEPRMEFQVDSQFQGRPIAHLVPLVIQQFRRAVRRKHVFPAFKVRYRPFFVNPLLQPSPDPADFAHISLCGGLEVQVVSASRLDVDSAAGAEEEASPEALPKAPSQPQAFVTLALAAKPLFLSSSSGGQESVAILVKLHRHSSAEPLGIAFAKGPGVVIDSVQEGCLAARAGFKAGDALVAINNMAVSSERQATKLLSATIGEVGVLVQRPLASVDEEEDDSLLQPPPSLRLLQGDEDFVHVDLLRHKPSAVSVPSQADSLDLPSLGPKRWRSLNDLGARGLGAEAEVHRRSVSPSLLRPLGTGDLSSSGLTGSSAELVDGAELPDRDEAEAEESRRRRLVGKATQKATILAAKLSEYNYGEKWETGKGMMRGFWHRRKGEEAASSPDKEKAELPVEPPVKISPPTAPPQDPVEVHEVGQEASESPVREAAPSLCRVGRQRSSSASDVAQLQRDGEEATREIRVRDSLLLSSEEPAEGLGKTEKRTRQVPLARELEWAQWLGFPELGERRRWLNVQLWRRERVGAEPSLRAFLSLYLPEVLDDCATTLSNVHQQTFVLRPPPGRPAAAQANSLTGHPGFDARLCHGDITLRFRHRPEGIGEEELRELEGHNEDWHQVVHAAALASPDSASGHSWAQAQFTTAVFCGLCQRKIWLKAAVQCQGCLLICHKKCQPKASQLMTCGAALGPKDMDSLAPGAQEDAVSLSSQGSVSSGRVAGKTKALKAAFSERFSNLRRRKTVPTPTSVTPTGEQPPSALDNPAIGDDSKGSEDFHDLLYTEGGTYNEEVISKAKDLGRGLFADLPLAQRKVAINEQVDKLQLDIDALTRDRMELQRAVAKAQAERRRSLEAQLGKLDDKLQSKAILMLHYCAGLQSVLDAEEEAEEEEAGSPDEQPFLSPLGETAPGQLPPSRDGHDKELLAYLAGKSLPVAAVLQADAEVLGGGVVQAEAAGSAPEPSDAPKAPPRPEPPIFRPSPRAPLHPPAKEAQTKEPTEKLQQTEAKKPAEKMTMDEEKLDAKEDISSEAKANSSECREHEITTSTNVSEIFVELKDQPRD